MRIGLGFQKRLMKEVFLGSIWCLCRDWKIKRHQKSLERKSSVGSSWIMLLDREILRHFHTDCTTYPLVPVQSLSKYTCWIWTHSCKNCTKREPNDTDMDWFWYIYFLKNRTGESPGNFSHNFQYSANCFVWILKHLWGIYYIFFLSCNIPMFIGK